MKALRLQIGLLSFAVLAPAVLVNIFFLQPVPATHATRAEPAKAQPGLLQPRANTGADDPNVPGEMTAAIQRELQSRGYATGPAGRELTPVLQAAIMAFEFDQGLPLTGEPSESLLRTMILGPANQQGPATMAAQPGPSARQVTATIQQALLNRGYGPLTADGVMSVATAQAIRRFEREQGMAETGRISGELVGRLAALGPAPHKR